MSMTTSLEVEELTVRYSVPAGTVVALDAVSLCLEAGVTLGVAGESGSGKTTLVNAVTGGLSGGLSGGAARVTGTVRYDGAALLELPSERLREFRRTVLGYIGQDPHASLDPTMRVGRQLRNAIPPGRRRPAAADDHRFHFGRVNLLDPARVAACYPHQLSGGMAQRVVIAMALAKEPRLIVADEPTASLDSTVRAHILRLITRLAGEAGAALLMVSHDLTAIRRYCDRTAVMYGGRIVELAQTRSAFAAPRHPYTAALLAAAPGQEAPGTRLAGIPGTQRVRLDETGGCGFADRCALRIDRCGIERPPVRSVDEHAVACHRAEELRDVPRGGGPTDDRSNGLAVE
jgi:peptide/nickel transport system ATP-binding protein